MQNVRPQRVSMLADHFLGRCLVYRGPTDRDHLRFPSVAIAGTATSLPRSQRIRDARALPAPAWPGLQAPQLSNLLALTSTTAFVAALDGEVVCEWYAPGHGPHTIGRNQSVTKSVASLLVGQALATGKLPSLEVPLGDLIAGLFDPQVARLTLAQLLRMASGIRYVEGPWPWTDDARVYHGVRLRAASLRVRMHDPVDAFFHYNDWHPLLLAQALERAWGQPVARVLECTLWAPLRGGPASMTLDHTGPDALAHLESGFNCSPEDLLRIGQLVLQRGRWSGVPLVGADWLARLDDDEGCWRSPEDFRHYASMPWGRPLSSGRYGYKDFWWHHWPRPGVRDVFAMGALGAHVYVSPDTRCVLVRQASRFPRGVWWAGMLRQIAEQLAD